MVAWDLLAQMAVALGIGGLIGLERERHHDERSVLAGVRTLPLVSLSGVLLVMIASRTGEPLVLAAGVLVFGALAVLMAIGKQAEGAAGFTTPVAFVATFVLGVLVGFDALLVAVSGAVAVTVLLLSKERLHRFAEVLSAEELRSAVLFVAIAFILYPITPAGPVAEFLDLRKALLVVILVSTFSFAAFLAMRRLGASRGIPVAGMLGGLVNSMAAVGALAPLGHPSMRRAAVLGVLLAVATSLGRNAAIALIADPSGRLVLLMAPALLVMTSVLLGAAWLAARRPQGEEASPGPPPIGNPFAIGPALRFGVVFLGLSALVVGLQRIPGVDERAAYVTALAGIVSAGAVVASMAVLAAQGSLAPGLAASVALLAIAFSVAAKAAVARSGDRNVAAAVLPAFAAAAVLGALGAGLVAWL